MRWWKILHTANNLILPQKKTWPRPCAVRRWSLLRESVSCRTGSHCSLTVWLRLAPPSHVLSVDWKVTSSRWPVHQSSLPNRVPVRTLAELPVKPSCLAILPARCRTLMPAVRCRLHTRARQSHVGCCFYVLPYMLLLLAALDLYPFPCRAICSKFWSPPGSLLKLKGIFERPWIRRWDRKWEQYWGLCSRFCRGLNFLQYHNNAKLCRQQLKLEIDHTWG